MTFPLKQASDAHRAIEARAVLGKWVVPEAPRG
jgi:hypothetical protein